MTDQERITKLEERVANLEAALSLIIVKPYKTKLLDLVKKPQDVKP